MASAGLPGLGWLVETGSADGGLPFAWVKESASTGSTGAISDDIPVPADVVTGACLVTPGEDFERVLPYGSIVETTRSSMSLPGFGWLVEQSTSGVGETADIIDSIPVPADAVDATADAAPDVSEAFKSVPLPGMGWMVETNARSTDAGVAWVSQTITEVAAASVGDLTETVPAPADAVTAAFAVAASFIGDEVPVPTESIDGTILEFVGAIIFEDGEVPVPADSITGEATGSPSTPPVSGGAPSGVRKRRKVIVNDKTYHVSSQTELAELLDRLKKPKAEPKPEPKAKPAIVIAKAKPVEKKAAIVQPVPQVDPLTLALAQRLEQEMQLRQDMATQVLILRQQMQKKLADAQDERDIEELLTGL